MSQPNDDDDSVADEFELQRRKRWFRRLVPLLGITAAKALAYDPDPRKPRRAVADLERATTTH
jgi:hypothetical protein